MHTHTRIHNFFTCTGAPTHTHISVCASMCECKGWKIHANTRTRKHTNIHLIACAGTPTHTHINMCVCINMLMQQQRSKNLHIHTLCHMYVNTHTHTHINVCASMYVADVKSCPNNITHTHWCNAYTHWCNAHTHGRNTHTHWRKVMCLHKTREKIWAHVYTLTHTHKHTHTYM